MSPYNNSYLYDLNTDGFEQKKAKIVDERTAELEDGTKLRITPKGQKKVNQLIFPGDIIKTNYGENQYVVVAVSEYKTYGLSTFSLSLADIDAKKTVEGYYRRKDCEAGINECVAQDNKILMLFYANKDEVFIIKKAAKTQSLLFGSSKESLIEPYKHENRKAFVEVKKRFSKTKCAFKNPFYCIDYNCTGCTHSCGGGCCVQTLEEIDLILQRDIESLKFCIEAKRRNRTIKIKVKDFRKQAKELQACLSS